MSWPWSKPKTPAPPRWCGCPDEPAQNIYLIPLMHGSGMFTREGRLYLREVCHVNLKVREQPYETVEAE